MTRRGTAAAAALLLLIGVWLSGCRWPDRSPDMLWVENLTQETLIVQPRDAHEEPRTLEAGKSTHYLGQPTGCEKAPWVAKTLSGDVVAEIPGACEGHMWTIHGVNNSKYK